MLETKLFEVLDTATCVPVLAVRMDIGAADDQERYLLRRSGYGRPLVLLTECSGGRCTYDPYDWNDRTFHTAHEYITEHWDELCSGDVVDVEFILGESDAPKPSERVYYASLL